MAWRIPRDCYLHAMRFSYKDALLVKLGYGLPAVFLFAIISHHIRSLSYTINPSLSRSQPTQHHTALLHTPHDSTAIPYTRPLLPPPFHNHNHSHGHSTDSQICITPQRLSSVDTRPVYEEQGFAEPRVVDGMG